MGIDFPRLLGYNHLTNQKEEGRMTNNEKNLIELIRGSEDPGKALIIAANIIADYLEHRGSSEEQAPALQKKHS